MLDGHSFLNQRRPLESDVNLMRRPRLVGGTFKRCFPVDWIEINFEPVNGRFRLISSIEEKAEDRWPFAFAVSKKHQTSPRNMSFRLRLEENAAFEKMGARFAFEVWNVRRKSGFDLCRQQSGSAFCALNSPPNWTSHFTPGKRQGEMQSLTWDGVGRKVLTIPRSKNGEMRHIPLNTTAISALEARNTPIQNYDDAS